MHQRRRAGLHRVLARGPGEARPRGPRLPSAAVIQRVGDLCAAFQVSSGGHLPPIGAMLRSLPFWAISLACFAFSWTLRVIFFYSPMFIRSKLNAEVQEVSASRGPLPASRLRPTPPPSDSHSPCPAVPCLALTVGLSALVCHSRLNTVVIV